MRHFFASASSAAVVSIVWFLSGPIIKIEDNYPWSISMVDMDVSWDEEDLELEEEGEETSESSSHELSSITLNTTQILSPEETAFAEWGNKLSPGDKKLLLHILKKKSSFKSLKEAQEILKKTKKRKEIRWIEDLFMQML